MNIKTKFLEEYVNFVDGTKKQNKYSIVFINLFAIFYVCFCFLFYLILIQNSIHTITRIQV